MSKKVFYIFFLIVVILSLAGCVTTAPMGAAPPTGTPYGGLFGNFAAVPTDNGTMMMMGQPSAPVKPPKQKFFRYGNTTIHLSDAFLDNPIMSFELSGLLAEQLATIVKINHLIMDRMPISIEDKWPELLRDWQLGLSSSNKDDKKEDSEDKPEASQATLKQAQAFDKATEPVYTCDEAVSEYKNQLDSHLKINFSFFNMFNTGELISGLKEGGGIGSIFSSPVEAMKKMALLKVSEEYGYSLLHARNVLSREPLGCKVKYPNAEFLDMHAQKTTDCKPLPKECEFFTMPLEEAILAYKNINSFIDTTVDTKCLRTVEGRVYESFSKAFYELLPSNSRSALEKVDNDYEQIDQKLKALLFEKESLTALLELKNSDNETQKAEINFAEAEAKLEVVKKEIDVTENKKSEIVKLREKLYKDAIKEIEVDPEKIKLAYKLKNITDYLDNSLAKVSATAVVLTASVIWDVKNLFKLTFSPFEAIAKTSFVLSYSSDSNLIPEQTSELVKTRLTKLLSRAGSLPVNIAAIAYGIKSQLSFLSPYRDYINAMVDLGVKKNLIALPKTDVPKKCLQLAKMPPFEVKEEPPLPAVAIAEPQPVVETTQQPETKTTQKASAKEQKTKTPKKTTSDKKSSTTKKQTDSKTAGR